MTVLKIKEQNRKWNLEMNKFLKIVNNFFRFFFQDCDIIFPVSSNHKHATEISKYIRLTRTF